MPHEISKEQRIYCEKERFSLSARRAAPRPRPLLRSIQLRSVRFCAFLIARSTSRRRWWRPGRPPRFGTSSATARGPPWGGPGPPPPPRGTAARAGARARGACSVLFDCSTVRRFGSTTQPPPPKGTARRARARGACSVRFDYPAAATAQGNCGAGACGRGAGLGVYIRYCSTIQTPQSRGTAAHGRAGLGTGLGFRAQNEGR